MTPQIAATLAILLVAIVLFVTEKLRVDLVALLVLGTLALTGLVTPAEALSGFSSPAVVTVWAVFILSGALARTGVADLVGKQILRLTGSGELRLLVVIMITAAALSAFMNNVGVAALLLPVVIKIARETGVAPSRLLMPLAIGCLLGGTTTLIGTSPNILLSNALREAGLQPFQLLDFAPMGLTLVVSGILFIALVGRRLLPTRSALETLGDQGGRGDSRKLYGLDERLALVAIAPGSPLEGKTLAESRLGRALGLTILGLRRGQDRQQPVNDHTVLRGGDRLLALGRLDRLEELGREPYFDVVENGRSAARFLAPTMALAELPLAPGSSLAGKSLAQIDARQKYGLNVVSIRRNGRSIGNDLHTRSLQEGDVLMLFGTRADLAVAMQEQAFAGATILESDQLVAAAGLLEQRLLTLRVPEGSPLAGRSLGESDLNDVFGLLVLAIARDGERMPLPGADTVLQAGDMLWVEGDPTDLAIVRGLQGLIIEPDLETETVELETETMGLAEAVLAPHSRQVGKTLREIHFREKYGLSVLAIWRNGRSYRTGLGDIALRFGDAFLLHGPRQKLALLGSEPDFVVLAEGAQEVPRSAKAPLAALIMAAVVLSVLVGWLPIAIAAIAGAGLMVLVGALDMEEAYRAINWRAVFLIACMLPMGIALETSGAAQYLADGMVALVGGRGSLALLAGLFLLTNIAVQVMPSAVVAVLMAPIAITTAADLALSPYALMMTVAIATSASFMSPIGHPANALVMGPGGYAFKDYIKVGLPLAFVFFLVTLLVLPLVWPL